MNALAAIFGTTPGVFLGVTVIFMGGCSYLAGQALAGTWRPAWQMLPYGLMLGCADRFLTYALFQGDLRSLPGYVLDAALITAVGFLAYRLTRARQMVTQYPWIYQRSGPLAWRLRDGASEGME